MEQTSDEAATSGVMGQDNEGFFAELFAETPTQEQQRGASSNVSKTKVHSAKKRKMTRDASFPTATEMALAVPQSFNTLKEHEVFKLESYSDTRKKSKEDGEEYDLLTMHLRASDEDEHRVINATRTLRADLLEAHHLDRDFESHDFFITHTGSKATRIPGHRMFGFIILKREKVIQQ